MPSPNDPHHAALESEVREHLLASNYCCPPPLTPADNWDPDITNQLKERNDYTSLYLRTRADRVAIHRTRKCQFQWDAKTNQSGIDVCIEAFPFCTYLLLNRSLGVRSLFCHRVIVIGGPPYSDYGVWATDQTAALVSDIYLPSRWEKGSLLKYAARIKHLFPNAKERFIAWRRGGGSGDPFVKIEDEVAKSVLRPWQVEVEKCRAIRGDGLIESEI